ncbi:unnamed protein product [Bursaphelenchus okinawaensis]|uniref:Uncharacterized protein n=1 Tax=Bursaphelenchus okinawaensis TaxID=465554 RepID=A0A811K315_9BILA|nr:unnamed protein product [Bursaphelenchus okinawaensis]CAG9089541.1 unnamed protein product [Bursaphelenchus okinawaensis]
MFDEPTAEGKKTDDSEKEIKKAEDARPEEDAKPEAKPAAEEEKKEEEGSQVRKAKGIREGGIQLAEATPADINPSPPPPPLPPHLNHIVISSFANVVLFTDQKSYLFMTVIYSAVHSEPALVCSALLRYHFDVPLGSARVYAEDFLSP